MRLLCTAAAVLCLAFLALPASAQVTMVTGVVKDQSGRPIKGAIVMGENAEVAYTVTRTSDAKGRFVVLGLRPGEWVFTIQAPGYEAVRTRSNVRALQRNEFSEVRLTRVAVQSSLGGLTGREIQQRLDAAEAAAVRGDLDAAIAGYRDVVARVPALTAIYLQLGGLYERKQDSAAALAAYRHLSELEPDNAKARAAIERLSHQ